MKTILVTGGSGFVAGYLKDVLAPDNVVLADKNKSSHIREIDITDKSQVDDLISDLRPDEIYHLAALPYTWSKDMDAIFKVNVEGTLNILRAVQEFSPKSKILLVSTAYVYGNSNKLIHESDSTNPAGFYGESKLEMEKRALSEFPDLNIYIARSFNHSGSGQKAGFFFPDQNKKISEFKKGNLAEIEVVNPDSIRDFLDVCDVVRAYKLILEKGKPREIYNVCSGKGEKIGELVEKLIIKSNIKNPKIKISVNPSIKKLVGSNEKLKSLGFKPRYSIDDIVEQFVVK